MNKDKYCLSFFVNSIYFIMTKELINVVKPFVRSSTQDIR